MKHLRQASFVVLSLFVALAAAPILAEAPTAAEPAQAEPAAEIGACGSIDSHAVLPANSLEVEDPVPSDICNCNEDGDCDAICGDAGGSCLITIPCEEGSRYTGWCYCNDGNREPVPVEPIRVD